MIVVRCNPGGAAQRWVVQIHPPPRRQRQGERKRSPSIFRDDNPVAMDRGNEVPVQWLVGGREDWLIVRETGFRGSTSSLASPARLRRRTWGMTIPFNWDCKGMLGRLHNRQSYEWRDWA